MRALADGAIMPQAIRGTEVVLQIVSAFVIGCYVDPKYFESELVTMVTDTPHDYEHARRMTKDEQTTALHSQW